MDTKQLSAGLRKLLNANGHGFQAKVHRICAEAAANGSAWVPIAAEFPVAVQSKTSRVDLVLRHATEPLILSLECKRTDPNRSTWCFGHLPGMLHPSASNEVLVDGVRYINPPRGKDLPYGVYRAFGFRGLDVGNLATHVAYVLPRADAPGDGDAPSANVRVAIEDACTQSALGANGLISHWDRNLGWGSRDGDYQRCWKVIPVVVTTAPLSRFHVTTDAVDLESGCVPLEAIVATTTNWVFHQYPVSPHIQFPNRWNGDVVDLAIAGSSTLVRTIPVVHIASLLAMLDFLAGEPSRLWHSVEKQ
jgi:hypothetical protein